MTKNSRKQPVARGVEVQEPEQECTTSSRNANNTTEEISREEDPATLLQLPEGNRSSRDFAAPRAIDSSSSQPIREPSTSPKPLWQPPNPYRAPASFLLPDFSGLGLKKPRTITRFDAGKFFHLEANKLCLLEEVGRKEEERFKWFSEERNISNPSYLLYHVWALIKDEEGVETADRCLGEWEGEGRRLEAGVRW